MKDATELHYGICRILILGGLKSGYLGLLAALSLTTRPLICLL